MHHVWTKVRPIKPWYFLVLAVLFAALALVSLRSNYAHMVELRDRVYAADEAGEGVDGALRELRNYVGQHMNTNLSSGENTVYPPIQLKHTYNRLVVQKGQQTNGQNQKVYAAAQAHCERLIPLGSDALPKRADCVKRYLDQHGGTPTYISPDLYKFDFYSPTWAPDTAGLSIVAAVVCLLASIILFVFRRSIHAAAK